MKLSKIIAVIIIIACVFLSLSLLKCSGQPETPPASQPSGGWMDPSQFDDDDDKTTVSPDTVKVKSEEPT